MVEGFRILAQHLDGLFIARLPGAGLNLIAAIGVEGFGMSQFVREPETGQQHARVLFLAEVIGMDKRGRERIARTQTDAPATPGMEQGWPNREAVSLDLLEAMRLVESGRKVVLNIGRGDALLRFNEAAGLSDG